MTETNKSHFILKMVYPDTEFIFRKQRKNLKEISKEALYVLDTNALLAPYKTGSDDIKKIGETYKKLIEAERLYVPNHVIREFARRRSTSISELFTNIYQHLSTIQSVKELKYPILGGMEAYENFLATRNALKDILKQYKDRLNELKEGIASWNWSDPVSDMYSKYFRPEILIDTNEENEEALLKEYSERLEFNIPPGNKDKTKDDTCINKSYMIAF